LRRLATLASQLGPDSAAACEQLLLFTVVGAAVAQDESFTFSLGDGLWALNGAEHRLGPFPGNAPPYLAYGLLDPTGPRFEIGGRLPTSELESALVATDGLVDLADAGDRNLPGRAEKVGPLSQFWREDRFFKNPDSLRRRLAVAARDAVRLEAVPARDPGLLPDDTTVAVIRRRAP